MIRTLAALSMLLLAPSALAARCTVYEAGHTGNHDRQNTFTVRTLSDYDYSGAVKEARAAGASASPPITDPLEVVCINGDASWRAVTNGHGKIVKKEKLT